MKKYQRGPRAGKLHNQARQLRKFKSNQPKNSFNSVYDRKMLEKLLLDMKNQTEIIEQKETEPEIKIVKEEQNETNTSST